MHRTKQRLRLAALLATAAWLGGASGAWASAPRIAVTPNENHPQGNTQVNGAAFGANEAVDVYFDTIDEALAVTNGAGNFAKTPIPVPASAVPGTHYVTAVGRHSGLAAQAVFTVNTDWAQFHYNEKRRGNNPWENVLSPSNVSSLDAAWTFTTGGAVKSSPAVVGGTLFVCSEDQNLYSLNAATGGLNWSLNLGAICDSSPAVAYGILYIGDNNGILHAINASTGGQVWGVGTTMPIIGAPAVASPGGFAPIVFVASESGYIYAYDAETGNSDWYYNTGSPIESSPAVGGGGDGVLWVGSTNGNMYAFAAGTGGLLLTAPAQFPTNSAPAIENGRAWFTENNNNNDTNYLNGLSQINECTINLNFSTNGQSSPAVANNVVYVGVEDGASAYSYTAGGCTRGPMWTTGLDDNVNTGPAVANGVVYVTDYSGQVTALSAATGIVLWNTQTNGAIESSPAVTNGMVYVGSDDDNIYAYALNGGDNRVYKNKRKAPAIHSLHPNWSLKPHQSENTAQHTENAD